MIVLTMLILSAAYGSSDDSRNRNRYEQYWDPMATQTLVGKNCAINPAFFAMTKADGGSAQLHMSPSVTKAQQSCVSSVIKSMRIKLDGAN